MPVLLILLATAVIELTVLLAVGKAIGVLGTIGLLVLASLFGAALLRREGIRTVIAFNEALRTRKPPHRELLDGMLIATAGVFIVLPGFVSDALGLLLLVPWTRAMIRRRLLRTAGPSTSASFTPNTIIDGEVVEGEVVDPPSVPRPGPELR